MVLHTLGCRVAGLDVAYVALQTIVALLVLLDLADNMFAVPGVEPVDK